MIAWKVSIPTLLLLCGILTTTFASASTLPELCPCLPLQLCPRIYGASADDRKYLGQFMKCATEKEVRCCGASVSSLVSSAVVEEKPHFSADNEIEDVRMEHLTIPPPPPPVITTTTEEIPTTTEMYETTTTVTEEPPETTTTIDEEMMTTTEMPLEDVTLPRFGKNVQFIYAVSAQEEEEEQSKRSGKKLTFSGEDDDDVFVIMPQQQLLEDESFNEIKTPITTTTEGGEDSLTTTEIPTTTKKPLIRKRIRVKVRKGFKLFPRLQPNDLLNLEEAAATAQENTRKNREIILEEKPTGRKKINHALYARRKQLFTTSSTTESPAEEEETTTIPTTTTTEAVATSTASSPSSGHQNPALLTLLTSNAAKRKNFYNRRILKERTKEVETTTNTLVTTEATPMKIDDKLEGQHKVMIEQVIKAVGQNSMMTSFDVANELMDPEMAQRVAKIQAMLAEQIMEVVLARIVEKQTTQPTVVVTENPINAAESKQPLLPYRGSKRYIDTNFLNAYENVIHKVEEKIKTHKTLARGRTSRPPVATTEAIKTKTTTEKTKADYVQVLLNNRQRTTTTTPPLPVTPVTEQSPALMTIPELIIEELEKIQDSSSDTEELSAPIDLLGRNVRNAQSSNLYVPIALPAQERLIRFA